MKLNIQMIFAVFCCSIINQAYSQNDTTRRERVMDCNFQISTLIHDSIISYGNPQCSYTFLNLDTIVDGRLIVYSEIDSSKVIYNVELRANKKHGIEYTCEENCYKEVIRTYYNGKLNGPSIFYTQKRVEFYYNFKDDLIVGNYFRYFYDDFGKLIQINVYNNANRLKRKIIF